MLINSGLNNMINIPSFSGSIFRLLPSNKSSEDEIGQHMWLANIMCFAVDDLGTRLGLSIDEFCDIELTY